MVHQANGGRVDHMGVQTSVDDLGDVEDDVRMARANGARPVWGPQRLARRTSFGPNAMRSIGLPPLWLVLAATATLVSLVVYAWPWIRLTYGGANGAP
jgi:hypothetical protein